MHGLALYKPRTFVLRVRQLLQATATLKRFLGPGIVSTVGPSAALPAREGEGPATSSIAIFAILACHCCVNGDQYLILSIGFCDQVSDGSVIAAVVGRVKPTNILIYLVYLENRGFLVMTVR